MYDDFASVYDTLMDDFDYDAWSAHYLTLIRTVTGELPRRAAECACGTGSLTVCLAQSGMAVTGVDLSAAMLRQAEKKARDYGVEVAFVRQDMKKLTLPRRVGAVLATCDGVNYLTTPNDVQAFFAAAYQNLLPGGALCFDCSTRHKLENVMGDAFFGEERDGAAVLCAALAASIAVCAAVIYNICCPWMSRSLFGKKMAAIDVFASSIISARTARKN